MQALWEFARNNPAAAAVLGGAVLVGLYFLLNRRSAAAKAADKRFGELRDQNRDRYRGLRMPK